MPDDFRRAMFIRHAVRGIDIKLPLIPPRKDSAFIRGVTRDTNSAALGGMTVDLFQAGDAAVPPVFPTPVWLQRIQSDANGNYTFGGVWPGVYYFCRIYLTGVGGNPDRAGTTANILGT